MYIFINIVIVNRVRIVQIIINPTNSIYTIKNIEININGLMPIDIAIITCGGIDVKQVNPKTMESKIIKNLFFAGEILDVDAYTGGFNLQIAFSTAVAAGKN